MDKFFILGSLLMLSVSCNLQRGSEPKTQSTHPTMVDIATDVSTPEPDINEPIESFADDSNIGRPRKNKIEIDIVARGGVDSANRPNNTAIIKFYSITASKEWALKQTLEIESYALMSPEPEIEDFNNDKLKDITFISNSAARGANEVRTLLIYDKAKDALLHVKNSEDYPNLAYNKTLNCIDAWLFHGATTTVFLKLDGDMLREFASVDTGSHLVVTVIDNNGEEREILRKKMKFEDIYTRYRTYNPPRY